MPKMTNLQNHRFSQNYSKLFNKQKYVGSNTLQAKDKIGIRQCNCCVIKIETEERQKITRLQIFCPVYKCLSYLSGCRYRSKAILWRQKISSLIFWMVLVSVLGIREVS